MTAEQREARLHELNEQSIVIRNEMRALEKEQTRADQQECLQWVGRAFKTKKLAVLITSVPPIQYGMATETFNKHQFPCIKVNLEKYEPPVFDETLFIRDTPFLGSIGTTETCYRVDYDEITVKEFQEILNQRIHDIVKLAATAKMRQQGKEVFSFRDGEICEK